jgi:hypothetical protein
MGTSQPRLSTPVITMAEWRWAAAFAAAVMVLTAAPYLVGVVAQTPEWRFGGLLIGVEDGSAYLARMAQGARGAWLVTPVYTSEPQPGALLYQFYVLLGKLSGPDHTSRLLVYHAARLVGGVLTLLASYRFLAEFLRFVRQRRLALVLVGLGGGLGWLLELAGQGGLLASLPLDFISPEAFTFLSLYALPHLAVSRALLVLGILAYLRGRGVWAGLAWLGVALIQPIHVLAMWAVIAVDMILPHPSPQPLGEEVKRLTPMVPSRSWRTVLTAVALPAPVVLYTLAVFALDPILRSWNLQSQLPSPHPVHYLLGYGLWLVPGAFGWRVLRRRPVLARWTAAWLLALPVLLYLPLPIQRRLAEGAQLPLVILAVLGLTVVLRRRWLTRLVLGASTLTSLFLVLGGLVVASRPTPPVFHAADQVAVFRWIAAHVDATIRGGQSDGAQSGLGAYETGNLIPVYTPLRAYLGLSTETVSYREKRYRVERFFRLETSDAERRDLLAEGDVRYVFVGPPERALGSFDPAAAPFLARRFESGAYAVYEVLP